MDVFPACCVWHLSGSNASGIDAKTGCCSCWAICDPWEMLLLLSGAPSELCWPSAQGEEDATATLLVISTGENCHTNRLILFSCTSFPCGPLGLLRKWNCGKSGKCLGDLLVPLLCFICSCVLDLWKWQPFHISVYHGGKTVLMIMAIQFQYIHWLVYYDFQKIKIGN